MAKKQNFNMRTDDDFVRALDNWRRAQPDIPPRAEAIRLLVRAGLEADTAKAENAHAGA